MAVHARHEIAHDALGDDLHGDFHGEVKKAFEEGSGDEEDGEGDEEFPTVGVVDLVDEGIDAGAGIGNDERKFIYGSEDGVWKTNEFVSDDFTEEG